MARISKEEQAKIREEIIRVASEKFNTSGFEQVSTKQIAKEVGIAEGTLFNYFDSKTHLFLEVFSADFVLEKGNIASPDITAESVVDVIFNHLMTLMKMMLKLPKGLLSELMIASVKLAKKHPDQFQRFVDLDFQYMAEMERFLEDLQERHLIGDVNPKLLSELIYSIVMYEFIMYLYDPAYSKEILKAQSKEKLHILLKGYCIGGQNGN